MSIRTRYHSWVLAVPVVLSALALGCGNQGEGERCDVANVNKDCQSGLLCRPITGLSYSLCCPPADQTSSAPACSNLGTPSVPDAAAGSPDASAVDGSGSDANIGDDATSDAGEEAAADEASEAAAP